MVRLEERVASLALAEMEELEVKAVPETTEAHSQVLWVEVV